MASLVADYSDSDEDVDTFDKNQIKQEVVSDVRIKEEPQEEITPTRTTNFFNAAEVDSDGDEEESEKKMPFFKQELCKEEVSATDSKSRLHNPLSNGNKKLPSLSEAVSGRIGTSVFINPFEEAEQAKNDILERHVRLTEAAPKKPAHQPLCWKFKKGKCHLGKNCRFFHDRENVTIEENAARKTDNAGNPDSVTRPVYHMSARMNAASQPYPTEPVDEDHYLANKGKRKRHGVTDHLLPPKKALESLQHQRKKERPWTMTQGF